MRVPSVCLRPKGLMQVIPSTARYISIQLDDPTFSDRDLFRPYVGIRYGTFYLAEQIDLLDGNRGGALAAYNGGPGNALDWVAIAGDDIDLLISTITFDETRRVCAANLQPLLHLSRTVRWQLIVRVLNDLCSDVIDPASRDTRLCRTVFEVLFDGCNQIMTQDRLLQEVACAGISSLVDGRRIAQCGQHDDGRRLEAGQLTNA